MKLTLQEITRRAIRKAPGCSYLEHYLHHELRAGVAWSFTITGPDRRAIATADITSPTITVIPAQEGATFTIDRETVGKLTDYLRARVRTQ